MTATTIEGRVRGIGPVACLLFGILVFALDTRAEGAEVIAYPRVPGDRASADIVSVQVEGVSVDTVSTDMNVGYAHFAFSGSVRVEITAREPIQDYDLSPHRAGIKAEVRDRVLAFELAEPRKLHLKINDLPRFFLFADAPEDNPPSPGQSGVFNLTDFEVASSLDLTQTEKIQRAIDTVASKKGTLYVPPGIYRTGELRLKSGLTLYLAPGAILKGTADVLDYPRGKLGTQLVDLLDCEGVRIQGRGVIDGQGRALRLATQNASNGRMKLVRSFRARDCLVEDVILRDSGTWTIHLVESSDLRFNNTKLISNSAQDDPEFPWEANTDGFDPDNSSRITIENGFISCHDDAIAVKLSFGDRKDMDDIQFRNNVVWTAKSALKIGTEVYDKKLTNVVFENNDVVHADRGIVIYCYRGATVENPRWLNNHFEFIGDDIKEKNLEIKIRNIRGKGSIQDILIKDNTFERFSPNQSLLQGLDSEHAILGVRIENLVIEGQKRTSLEDAQIKATRHVNDVTFP